MFCNATTLLSKLKVLLASTSKKPSEFSLLKTVLKECIAASTPGDWPVQSCNGPLNIRSNNQQSSLDNDAPSLGNDAPSLGNDAPHHFSHTNGFLHKAISLHDTSGITISGLTNEVHN